MQGFLCSSGLSLLCSSSAALLLSLLYFGCSPSTRCRTLTLATVKKRLMSLVFPPLLEAAPLLPLLVIQNWVPICHYCNPAIYCKMQQKEAHPPKMQPKACPSFWGNPTVCNKSLFLRQLESVTGNCQRSGLGNRRQAKVNNSVQTTVFPCSLKFLTSKAKEDSLL